MRSDSPYFSEPVDQVRRRVTAGASWTTGLYFGSRLIELAFTIILARLLSPAEFGVIAAGMVFIQFAKLFVEIGIGAAIVQTPDISRFDVRTAGTLVAFSALIFFSLTQLAAPAIAGFFQIAHLEEVVRVLAFLFLFQAAGVVPENLLIRRLDAHKVMLVEICAKLLGYGCVGAACAYLGLGYWALVIGALSEALLKAFALVVIARPPLAPMAHAPSLRRLLGRGLGFSTSRILNFIALSADNVMAGRLLGPAGLGLYSRAYNLMSLPAEVYGRVAERLVFPALAIYQDDKARLQRAFLAGTAVTATFGLPLSVVLVLLAPEIIHVLLGAQWAGVIAPFAVLSVASYARLGAKISGSLLRAAGAFKALIGVQAVYALCVVAGAALAAPFGIVALAGAVSASACVFFVLISACACAQTATSPLAFIAAHVRGVLLGAATAALLGSLILILREAHAAAWLTLLAALSALAAAALLVAAAAPPWLLGEAGARLVIGLRDGAGRVLRRVGLRSRLAGADGERA